MSQTPPRAPARPFLAAKNLLRAHGATVKRFAGLATLLAASVLLHACACGGGGSGRTQCDPFLSDACICADPATEQACNPEDSPTCFCTLDVDSDGTENNGTNINDVEGANNGDTVGDDNNAFVGASLSFDLHYGAEAGRPFQEVAPWATAVLPAYRTDDAASPVVFMLCTLDDPRCVNPVVLRPVAPDETDGAPMQFTFGPSITLRDLPPGEFHLMVFLDTETSRTLGEAWDDPSTNRSAAWGGAVSETDLLLSAAPAPGQNPAPAPLPVQLTAGETTSLGTQVLGHFAETDQSPAYQGDSGRLVAASPTGVYIVDAATRDVAYAELEHEHVICGMIDAPGDRAWLLLDDAEGAGVAVEIDTIEGVPTGAEAQFPGVGMPCRGVYHRHDGIDYLFVVDASGSRGPDSSGGDVVWSARVVPGVAQGRSRTSFDEPLFGDGINDIVALGDALYLTTTPERGVPREDRGHHLVLAARFDRNGVISTTDYVVAGAEGDRGVDPQGRTPVNDESAASWAGLHIARFHDGRDLLFVGGYSEIEVLELPALTPVATLSGHYFGTNFTGFTASPSGDVLWAIPQSKSAYHFEFERGPGGDRQSYNRLMALPVDLSRGQVPAASDEFTGNIDGYEGPTLSGNLTPGNDPGIDLGYGHYVSHQVLWAPGTAGATFGSSAFPVGHTAAATDKNLWLRGSGTLGDAGPSGLGKGGDLAVFDLESRRAILHAEGEDPFFGTWSGGVYGQPTFGFRLDSADAETTTVGLLYEAGQR